MLAMVASHNAAAHYTTTKGLLAVIVVQAELVHVLPTSLICQSTSQICPEAYHDILNRYSPHVMLQADMAALIMGWSSQPSYSGKATCLR